MKKSTGALALLSSAAMIWTSAAAAQAANPADRPVGSQPAQDTTSEAPASGAPSAEADIVVTAQRREQRLQDVPISVQVTTGDSIAKSGTTDLASLATRLPSVQIGQGVQSNNIRIRGVGSGLNAGFEQSVGVFVDGVYRPRSRTIQAGLFDVERVEVLNGPQTTFFGNNTIAGAINVTTKKPSMTFGYDGQLLYAPTDGQFIAQAGVTGPLSDTLSARAAIQASGMDGYIYNRFTDSKGPRMRDIVVRGALHFEPSATFASDLRVDYARNRDRGTFNAEIEGCPPPAGFPAARGPCALYINRVGGAANVDNVLDFRADTGPSNFRLDFAEGAWTNRLDFGNAALIALTSYSHSDSRTFLQGTPLAVTGVAGYFHQPFSQNETYTLFSQELRLESQGSGWLQYVGGLYYSHGDLFSDSYASLFNSGNAGSAGAPVTSAASPIGTNRSLSQTDQTRSAFAQLTVAPVEALKIAGGLRYTSVKKEASRRGRVGIGSPTASPSGFVELDAATQARIFPVAALNNAPFADPETTYDKLMPSVSATYTPNPRLTIYGSYSAGFKAGGYSDSNQPAQFDSETVDAFEVGVKGSLFDRRLFFTLNAFHSNFKNLQQALNLIGPTGALITTVGNAASSTSRGIEVTGTLRTSQALSINLAASYIRSRFDDYRNAACTQAQIVASGARCVQDLSGQVTPFAPELSATGGFTGELPAGGDDRSLRIEPSAFYSTGYFLAPTNDPLVRQDRFVQADLRLGWGPSDRSWEVAVIGRNLNDARVKAVASAVGTSPGLSYAVLQRARSVAFSVLVRR